MAARATDENFERLLPGTNEFLSPVYLPDPRRPSERESVPYFPEKEQDHEASAGDRLSESIAPLMSGLVGSFAEPAQDESHPEQMQAEPDSKLVALDQSTLQPRVSIQELQRNSLIAIALRKSQASAGKDQRVSLQEPPANDLECASFGQQSPGQVETPAGMSERGSMARFDDSLQM